MSSDGFRERKREAGTETDASEREAEDGPLHPRGPSRQWRLLDIVTAAIIASVVIVFMLIFTPMGDSTAAAGRRALAQMTSDPQNRDKVLRWVQEKGLPLEPCDLELSDHIPCHDPKRAAQFSRERNAYRERHCPGPREKLACLIPPPVGYQTPVQWPASLHEVWKSNIPYTKISERKGHQGWMREEGDKFVFPGGGTMFPDGAIKYIQRLSKWIPLDTGQIRTALDMGCGVASFGAYLLRKNVLTMSFAPRDSHKAQIQFALERGIPAFVAMLGTQRLPFPSRAFDLVHCSRCLIPFTAVNGSYLLEMDRLLRPGGYFVISGPPVRWNGETEWSDLQALARGMCYQKVVVDESTAIFQKAPNHSCYAGRGKPNPPRCSKTSDPNAAWYVTLSSCVTRLPKAEDGDEGWDGGKIQPWPLRLSEPPRRLLEPSIQAGLGSSSGRRSDLAYGNKEGASSSGPGAEFRADTRRWKSRVDRYEELLGGKFEDIGIRNILDMNAGYGGFAAGLATQQVWVMNAVPVGTESLINTLPVIYDRGLIGLYHDWCEAFSTYPRTYDLIHVVNIRIFTTEMKRCTLVEVLLEMDRILRPEGTVIFRDGPKMLDNIAKLAKAIRWDTQIFDPESSSGGNKRLLVARKQFWRS